MLQNKYIHLFIHLMNICWVYVEGIKCPPYPALEIMFYEISCHKRQPCALTRVQIKCVRV